MRALITLPALLLLIFWLVESSCAAKVRELTPRTIDAQLDLSNEKPLLLEIMAPWCSHCQAFAGAYKQVAAELKNIATVAKVNGAAHKILTLRFRVRGFPTFFLIYKGKVFEFDGKRSVQNMVEFAQSNGAVFAKPHNYFIGPLSPYWRVVGVVYRAVHDVMKRIEDGNLSSNALMALIGGAIAALLLVFLLLIYFVTKPSIPVPKRNAAAHAHAD